MKVGIYGVFINKYIHFLDHFLKNSGRFLGNHEKVYFIVTDKDNEDLIKEYQEEYNIHYFLTDFIGWPYESLYRYVYFDQFDKAIVNECKYIYSLNGNIIFLQDCNDEVLPDKTGYVFASHTHERCQGGGDTTKSDSMELNKNSSCYLSPRKNLNYIIGGIFGCETDKFLKLIHKLKSDVFENEKNNHIAIWHDETHLNYYVNEILKNNVKYLPPPYVLWRGNQDAWMPPELGSMPLWKLYYNNKVDFLRKDSLFLEKPTDHNVVRYGKIIKNPYNSHIVKELSKGTQL